MPSDSEYWQIIKALVHENKRLRRKLRLDARPPFARPMLAAGVMSDSRVELTPAQLAVAECIVEAMTTRQIAAHLGVEASTIKTHRRAIKRLLGVSDCEGLKACRGRWMRD